MVLRIGTTLACSLCDSGLRSQITFRQEFEDAKIVLYGTLANPQIKPGAPAGTGTTEFHIEKVLKNNAALGGRNMLMLNQYIPRLDVKNKPKFVVFVTLRDGKLNPYSGRPVKTEAVLSYLNNIQGLRGKDRTDQLLYYFKYLDSADDTISKDAFLEFARLNDQEVGEIAKHLPPDKLRAWLKDPKTPSERLSLYAFLLGAGDKDKDAAALLRQMIERPDGRTGPALDGLLSGYINLKPREGWDLAASILGDTKKPSTERFAAARTLRFYHAWKPTETHKEVLRCLGVMLHDGEIADIAIDNLREWKEWDFTKQILASYDKPAFDSPIARRNIIRYALCCPQPEARSFIDALSRKDPDLVAQVKDSLDPDSSK
jgi:hypothetical protein